MKKRLDLAALAQRTEGWSGAELAGLMRETSLLAMRGYLDAGKDAADAKALAQAKVTHRHVEAAFEKLAARRRLGEPAVRDATAT